MLLPLQIRGWRWLKMKNKRAIAETLTWFFGFIVIFIILFIFVFFSGIFTLGERISGIKSSVDIGSVQELEKLGDLRRTEVFLMGALGNHEMRKFLDTWLITWKPEDEEKMQEEIFLLLKNLEGQGVCGRVLFSGNFYFLEKGVDKKVNLPENNGFVDFGPVYGSGWETLKKNTLLQLLFRQKLIKFYPEECKDE